MNSERTWRRLAFAGLATALAPGVSAAPIGPRVSTGTAVVTQSGGQTAIKVSNVAVINWNSFNIGRNEGVTFNQPSRASVVWNFIGDAFPSHIDGHLSANGFVVLMNQNGFIFGDHSVVNVGGLVVTTGHPAPNFSGDGQWEFMGMPPAASIINYGNIKVSDNSSLFMIAEKVENHGILQAPDGTIGLYAGKEVLISNRPDGRGLSAKVKLPSGSVDLKGALIADGGSIAVAAKVVNVDGVVQANSIRENHGVIELTASESVNLGPDSSISAQGAPDGVSGGGKIVIKSGGDYHDDPATRVSVAGGTAGGDGGSLEVSSARFDGLTAQLEGTAMAGFSGGTLLIDPARILVNKTGTAPSGTPAGTLVYNYNTAFKGFKDITLQADSDITVDAQGTWNLANSIGGGAAGDLHSLNLQSGGNITLKDTSVIKAGDGWSVSLSAGTAGAGSIAIGGTKAASASRAGIQTTTGDISLVAYNDINLGNGAVTTIGGGNIVARAANGDIRTGLAADSFVFSTAYPFPGYKVSPSLGGISTAAGGNVTLDAAKGSIFGDSQGKAGNQVPGSSGAFGALPGNVTITAGQFVTGTYTVANGDGWIVAGKDVGNDQNGTHNGLDLQLIKGSWSVAAKNDIYLNEVRNPDGTYNANGQLVPAISSTGKTSYYNDYAPDAAANFYAGHGLVLQTIAGNLPRLSGGGANNTDLAPVFPPILNISAGAGGIYMPTLDSGVLKLNELVLYPSSKGYLSVNTFDGGNFYTDSGGTARIVESDGAQYQNSTGRPANPTGVYSTYYDFAYDNAPSAHAAVPVHASGPVAHDVKLYGADLFNGKFSPTEALDPQTGNALVQNGSYLNIGGSIGIFNQTDPSQTKNGPQISFAQKADVTVGGSLFNAGLYFRQYSMGNTSTLNVAGTKNTDGTVTGITYTLARAKVTLDKAPNLAAIDEASRITNLGDPYTTLLQLNWNPTTKELAWTPAKSMTASQLAFLLNPVLPTFDPKTGAPVLDANGKPVTHPVTFLDAPQKLTELYVKTQNTHAPDGAAIAISGPGKLSITSGGSVDLGSSAGIIGAAPDTSLLNLPSAGALGAEIDLSVKGDLHLTTSRISTEALGGNIRIGVTGGGVDVGSQDSLLASVSKTGIYTTFGGNIDIVADGNIAVNGSRVATFRGGDISITSNSGNIDAGRGGAGTLEVEGKLYQVSGIITMALDGSDASPGNITVDAVKGNFVANKGGVLQVALNGKPLTSAISITTGGDLDAGQSGVVGGSVSASAGGKLNGNFFASGAVNLTAQQSITANAIGQSVSASSSQGSVGGNLIGGSVTASGATVDANVISANATVSGNSAGATVGTQAASGNTGPARTEQSTEQTVAKATTKSADDDDERKRRLKPKLVRTVGRVTVVLPNVPKAP